MPLRIAIDIRHARDFGFGTYIRNLIQAMARIETREEFLLIGREPDYQAFGPLPENFALHHYEREDSGFENQWRLPLLLRNLRPNLTHIPLNEVPLCLPRPYVVTIHDMSSVLFSGGGDARQQFQMFKVRRGLERADRILTVSSATQRDVQTLLDIRRRCWIFPPGGFVRSTTRRIRAFLPRRQRPKRGGWYSTVTRSRIRICSMPGRFVRRRTSHG